MAITVLDDVTWQELCIACRTLGMKRISTMTTRHHEQDRTLGRPVPAAVSTCVPRLARFVVLLGAIALGASVAASPIEVDPSMDRDLPISLQKSRGGQWSEIRATLGPRYDGVKAARFGRPGGRMLHIRDASRMGPTIPVGFARRQRPQESSPRPRRYERKRRGDRLELDRGVAEAHAVPTPDTLGLFVIGIVALVILRRMRARADAA